MVAFSAVAAIQQARAAAFFSLTQQAAVHFAIIEDDQSRDEIPLPS